jgi:hypothetical protein
MFCLAINFNPSPVLKYLNSLVASWPILFKVLDLSIKSAPPVSPGDESIEVVTNGC